MTYKIKKLNQLKHVDSFLQVNFIKGFKYIDSAGEIVNYFYDDFNQEPFYNMTQRELIIKKSIDSDEDFKVAVDSLWYHKTEPNNLGELVRVFKQHSQGLLNILEIKEIRRVGWRNYFVYEFNSKEDRDNILESHNKIEGLKLIGLDFEAKVQMFNLKIRIKSVKRNDASQAPAILFDVDCLEKYEKSSLSGKLPETLNKMKDFFYSDSFLSFVNAVLGEQT